MKPPIAKIIEEMLISPHGDVRIDKYFWLNKRDDPEVMKALKAENAFTDLVMAHTEELQTQLYDEIVGRIKKDDSSVPYKKDGFYYYSRYEKEKEYPFYCRKKESMDNPEDVMLDVTKMAEGFSFYNVGGMAVSTNNSLLAYSVDTVSRRKYSICFKDLETGDILEDIIPNSSGSISWANDNKTIFYVVRHEETLLPYKVYTHKLGTDVSEDKVVYEEKDNTFSTSCYKTKSKRYILISISSTLTTEFRFLDADHPDDDFRIIHPRERDLEYYIDHFKGHFYIRTNFKAKNFRLMKTSVNKTGKSNWTEVIPHRKDVLLEDFEIFSDFLVLSEKKFGLSQLRVKAWQGDADYYIGFDEETYDSWISINPDFKSKVLRFGYTSLTTPRSTYDFDMFTQERSLLKRDEVVGDFDPSNYEAKRLFAVAGDGTSVPVSIVFRKGIKRDGNNPLWITGYGSYGYSYDPYFSSVRLSLLDRGFIFAIAHIRGGQEMGRSWYEDGKLLKKKNTFTDFIDCVEFLIKESYTSPEKVFASGGSAGGLLMGAVVNMRPELFRGIIADVPFVDVVTTMLDESIPLTTGEYDEWGNPNDKEYYDYMKSYSPYENVQAKAYPAMLITTGYHDSQVQYWEPAKWVAKLREVKTDNHLLIFKIHIDYGHGGASGRFQKYKEVALAYAFVLDQLKI